MELTNSERSCYRRCPRKWYYNYQLLRVPVQTSEPLWFGSAIGKGLDAIWDGRSDFLKPFSAYIEKHGYKDSEKLLVPNFKGEAMLTAYSRLYLDDLDTYEVIATEHPISYDMNGVTLKGMLDKVLRHKISGKLYVLDHKTTKDDIQDPSSDYWQIKILDPQLVGYKVALEAEFGEPVSMIYDSIKKHGSKGPKLRKGVRKKQSESDEAWEMRKADETESWKEYADRLMSDYCDNPDEYFRRRVIERSKEELVEWEGEFMTDAHAIEHAKGGAAHPKNHGSCGKAHYKCEYFNVCTKMDSIESDNFVTKKFRHPELENEKEGAEDVII